MADQPKEGKMRARRMRTRSGGSSPREVMRCMQSGMVARAR